MERLDKDYGHLEIQLAKLMEKKGLNRNRVAIEAAMNWKQVDKYCHNDVSRLDTFVLCKLCSVLKCDIDELLVYIPAEKCPDR